MVGGQQFASFHLFLSAMQGAKYFALFSQSVSLSISQYSQFEIQICLKKVVFVVNLFQLYKMYNCPVLFYTTCLNLFKRSKVYKCPALYNLFKTL